MIKPEQLMQIGSQQQYMVNNMQNLQQKQIINQGQYFQKGNFQYGQQQIITQSSSRSEKLTNQGGHLQQYSEQVYSSNQEQLTGRQNMNMQQQQFIQQHQVVDSIPETFQINSNRSNIANTQINSSQHKTARSQGTVGVNSMISSNQAQNLLVQNSQNKKSKKKQPSRLPPPKIQIQQPNFSQNGGEREPDQSYSYSDNQENEINIDIQGNLLKNEQSQVSSQNKSNQNRSQVNQNKSDMHFSQQNSGNHVNNSSYLTQQQQYKQQNNIIIPTNNPNQISNLNMQQQENIQEVDIEKGNSSDLDSEEIRDREYMANWNFAEASISNSIVKPADNEQDIAKNTQFNTEQLQQNVDNQLLILNSKRQNEQKIFNEYLVQDLSKQSPRKGIQLNEINPIILNSNIEENSRFTELSSIRETQADQLQKYNNNSVYGQKLAQQFQQQYPIPQNNQYQYLQQQYEDYIPQNILAVQNQIKQQIQQNVVGFNQLSLDGPQQQSSIYNPPIFNNQNQQYDPISQNILNINPNNQINQQLISQPKQEFFGIQSLNQQPCQICINENKKRRKKLIKQNLPAEQFQSIICNHQFQQQPINELLLNEQNPMQQLQYPQQMQNQQKKDNGSEESGEDQEDQDNSSNSYENEEGSDESFTSESDESCLTFHDDPSVQPDQNQQDQKGLSYFGKGPQFQNLQNMNQNQQNRTYDAEGRIVENVNRESHLLPIYFAKEHIIKIEEDMKKMHERHVNLMREMDKNYKLIEEETQEYYIEFLKKWKEVAKQRIQSYRKTTEALTLEKEKIEKEKAIESDNLNQQITKLLKEKQNLQVKLNEDIIARDTELELQKLEFEQKLKKKEQEIFNLQNQNKKLELQMIEIAVEKKSNVEQLKSQIDQMNEQIDQLQQSEQNLKVNVGELQSQLEENQIEKTNFKTLFDQYRQDILELKKQVSQGLSQLNQKKDELQIAKQQMDKKEDEINKLQANVEQLNNQVKILKQVNMNIQAQEQQMNQDQGQISSSLQSKQNDNSQSILSSLNSKKPSEKQIKFPNNDHNSNSQPPNPAASQQSQLLSQIKIRQIGAGSKNIILKPQSILQNQNQSFNSVVSSGSNSIGIGGLGGVLNSKVNQNLLQIAPMSEQDYQSKLTKIQIDFNKKLDEIKNLMDFLNSKIQFYPSNILQDNSSYSNSQSIQSDSQTQQIQFDLMMKQKLEYEEKEQKKQMNDEILKLKRTYEQSQKAQIHQKNNIQTQQNRNSSLQFMKRNDNNSSNLSKIESADVSINQNLTSNTLNKLQQNLKIQKKNLLNSSIENPYSSNTNQSQILNKESPIYTKGSEESKSGSLQGSGQSGVSNQIQMISQGALLKNIIPQGLNNEFQNNFSILKSAREPTNKLSLRDLNQDDNSYQNIDSQTQTQLLKELKLKIQNLSNENQELSFKIQGLEKELTGKKDLEKELQDVRLSLITGISAIQSQRNNDEITKLNDLLKNHEEVQKELEELKKELKAKKKEYASNLQYAKTKCDQLKQIAAKLNDDKTALKGKLKSLEAVNDKMKNQGDELIQQQRQESISLKKQNDELRDQNDRLWLKYQTETIQRKRLHNQIEDMKGKIRVYCRVRPMNVNEMRMGCIDAISLVDQFTLRIRVKKDQQLYKQSNQIQSSQAQQANQYTFKEFVFDSCFGQKTTQDEIFEDTKMLIQSAIDGFNVCIFAYGQTGSGKTYTVTGTDENKGIVPRGFQEMFLLKSKMEKDGLFKINFQCYMVELYLDKLNDLLIDGQKNQNQSSQTNQDKLEIREDPVSGMVYIQNAKHKQLYTYEEALDTFNQGLKSRRVSSTEMNDQSSRSHLIFSVVIEALNKKNGEICKGKISFVDLAGSERSHKSNPNFNLERQKESNAINLSLKSLGDVIACLSNEEMSKAHIPYRNNKLTYLMKDSLGGNSKTLMFVNISPADYNAQESLNSLQFGHRVKMVQNEVSKNIETDVIQKLKQENYDLKKKLGE